MLAVALFLASLTRPAMDYPTPAQAGFHHCALIYRNESRTVDDMKPYAAQWQDGKPRRWLFDAFLYLVYTTSRGRRTEVDPTQKTDWQEHLDGWFKPGRDLDSLDKALDEAAKGLGAPSRKRQVIFSIPYTHSEVTDFGDADGDGVPEDLSTEAGRRAVLHWYVAEAERRFRQAGFKHLELWGFYWMNEATGPGDAEKISLASQIVHQRGFRLLWIPWHRAPRWEQWRSFGFDVALMQPNYAFVTAIHKGAVKRNRLAANADLARANGLGVEIEMGNVVSSDVDRRAFYHYLVDGAKSKHGYQEAATAYYLANDNVERCAASADPEVRRVYELMCDYVSGQEVPEQDPQILWDEALRMPIDLSKPARLRGRLARPVRVQSLEVFLDESDSAWQGTIRAETKSPSGRWTPAGWAIKADRDANSGRRQIAVIPIEQEVAELRLTFSPAPGSRGLLTGVGVDATKADPLTKHLAYLNPYTMEPPLGSQPSYGDGGGFLTDGYVPKLGFIERKSVGWMNQSVAIAFDLRKEQEVEAVEAVVESAPGAAVYPPASSLALLSAAPIDLRLPSGLGALPEGLVWLAPSKPLTERQREDGSQDLRLRFATPKPARARYAAILMQGSAWLMVSEVRIFAGGTNVAPEGTYTLNPSPTVETKGGVPYPDDGRKLTDGRIAQGFEAGALVGWSDGSARTFTLDLGAEKTIRSVSVWSLRGGLHAIFSPESVSVEFSSDGKTWLGRQTVAKDRKPEDGKTCEPCAFKVEPARAAKARYVRVQAVNAKGWTMLSEIAVEQP